MFTNIFLKEYSQIAISSTLSSIITLYTCRRSLKDSSEYQQDVFELILYDILSFYCSLIKFLARRRGTIIHILFLFFYILVLLKNKLQFSLFSRVILIMLYLIKTFTIHKNLSFNKDVVSRKIMSVLKMRLVCANTTKNTLKRILYVVCIKRVFLRLYFGIDLPNWSEIVFLMINGTRRILQIRSYYWQYVIDMTAVCELLFGNFTSIMDRSNYETEPVYFFESGLLVVYIVILSNKHEIDLFIGEKKMKPEYVSL